MAKRYLDEHGLNTLWEDIEKYHNTIQHETEGAIDGALLELTAKSKPATQVSTTGKNLLPNRATSRTSGGITFTVNADGSVAVSGTATMNVTLILCIASTFSAQPAGTYTISGGFEGCFVSMQYADSASPDAGITGNFQASISPSSLTVQNGLRIASGNCAAYLLVPNGTTVNGIAYPQLEAGSTATPYEPYTGGAPSPSPDYPQPIVTVRGRNLYDGTRVAGYVSADGSISGIGEYSHSNAIAVESGKSYVWSGLSGYPHTKRVHACDANGNFISSIASALIDVGAKYSIRFEVPAGVHYVMGTFHNSDSQLQLTLGSTPQPYIPYDYVGLERRDLQGTLLSTTPIPLPQRGWVAGLPDGAADELSIDGAGKVVWTENTTIATKSDTSKYSDWDTPAGYTVSFAPPNQAIESAEIMCNKLINDDPWYTARCISIDRAGMIRVSFETSDGFAAAIPFDYLYPLATPVTEDCGYIDLPDMQDCVLSIPELDALGVRYTIGDGAEIARQWYEKAYAELGDAIVELTDRVVELEQRIQQ